MNVAGRTDTVCLGVIKRGRRHEHRGHTDEAVESGDQLRQRRHLDPQRHNRPDCTADQNAENDQPVADDARMDECRHHGDDHADNAEDVALSRRLRIAQAAQRQDEQHRRDDIKETGEIFCHCSGPLLPNFFLEHRQHSLGDDETTKDVDGRQKHREEAHYLRKVEVGGSRRQQAADDDHR